MASSPCATTDRAYGVCSWTAPVSCTALTDVSRDAPGTRSLGPHCVQSPTQRRARRGRRWSGPGAEGIDVYGGATGDVVNQRGGRAACYRARRFVWRVSDIVAGDICPRKSILLTLSPPASTTDLSPPANAVPSFRSSPSSHHGHESIPRHLPHMGRACRANAEPMRSRRARRRHRRDKIPLPDHCDMKSSSAVESILFCLIELNCATYPSMARRGPLP